MDAQIGESSACATALMCGVKTNFETVGLDARGKFENCFSSFSSRVPSLIDWAQESGNVHFYQCCYFCMIETHRTGSGIGCFEVAFTLFQRVFDA
ncbi:hypothetical protein GWI33_010367 [Rhynchophorus ferrugineus]|uniref:alkaline phosphatase n=1 Tax=Rhynchophorus ferrugineus TaxID=354439 RepID=A0A834IAW4_RHYFE|nr:hypothetical protein GWI33_010367 [Rhynchophorus ferrugineus]